jgi:dihydropteridine reductase
MLSYGVSKIGVHQLIRSAALSCDGQVLPLNAKCIGIVPVTIDTPANRSAMSDADFDQWTKCEEFAQQIFEWSKDTGSDSVVNGGLYQFNTRDQQTTVTLQTQT